MILLKFFLHTAPEPVAYAVYILDIKGMFPVNFQFPADTVDMYHDAVIIKQVLAVPYRFI